MIARLKFPTALFLVAIACPAVSLAAPGPGENHRCLRRLEAAIARADVRAWVGSVPPDPEGPVGAAERIAREGHDVVLVWDGSGVHGIAPGLSHSAARAAVRTGFETEPHYAGKVCFVADTISRVLEPDTGQRWGMATVSFLALMFAVALALRWRAARDPMSDRPTGSTQNDRYSDSV